MEHRGSVIGISSIAGYRGLPARAGYSSSKFALNGFLEVLRTELMKTVSMCSRRVRGLPPPIFAKAILNERRHPAGRFSAPEESMMSAEECAMHIYRATVKRRKILILTGQGKLAVFLNKWIPGIMDGIVYKTLARSRQSAQVDQVLLRKTILALSDLFTPLKIPETHCKIPWENGPPHFHPPDIHKFSFFDLIVNLIFPKPRRQFYRWWQKFRIQVFRENYRLSYQYRGSCCFLTTSVFRSSTFGEQRSPIKHIGGKEHPVSAHRCIPGEGDRNFTVAVRKLILLA